MKQLNGHRMRLVLVGFVAAIVLGSGNVKADFTFGEPINLGPTVNSLYGEACQSISSNGLTLYFSEVPYNVDPSGYGGGDIWVTMRNTIKDAWGSRTNDLPTVNTSSGEATPCMSADGLSLYFASNRVGGEGGWDLWMTTRETIGDPWGDPVNLGPTVNSSADEAFPSISADGLELYFSDYMVNRPAGHGSADIWITKRPTKDDPWGTPVNLGDTVNGWYYDAGPFISADSLTLLFTSHLRPGGISDADDIWMTRRAKDSDLWCTPVNLGPPINGPLQDGYPSLSADGSTLYFCSDRSGSWDLWQASVIPIVDFNVDGIVDAVDICMMVDYWGTDESLYDIAPSPFGDGIVDVQDLIVLSGHLFEDVEDPTLITHWALDETEGMFAADSVGNNDAVILGGVEWQPTGGQIDGALKLDGVSGYALAGFVLNPSDGPFSIIAWIKGGAPGQVVVSQQNATNWLAADVEGNLMTELNGAGRSTGPLFSQSVIIDGQWHRIGLVWDGSYRILYIDNMEVAKDTATQNPLKPADGGLYIGAGKNLEAGTFFSGLIDDVLIYNRAVKP